MAKFDSCTPECLEIELCDPLYVNKYEIICGKYRNDLIELLSRSGCTPHPARAPRQPPLILDPLPVATKSARENTSLKVVDTPQRRKGKGKA